MSNSFSTTDASAGQRTFYGEPQHESNHVSDRDIFCETESRTDERGMYVQTTHYTVADEDFARVESENSVVRAA